MRREPRTISLGTILCRRVLSAALLLFMTAWFGVIVPGHQRGSVQLAGASSHPVASDHSDRETDCCSTAAHAEPKKDSDKPKSTCAICYFMLVTLPYAAACVTELPPTGPPVLVESSDPANLFSADPILSCTERGPPAIV